MLQIVRFGNCTHIFDTEKKRFVKSTARQVANALGLAGQVGDNFKDRTRRKMLSDVAWQKCPGCHLGKKERKDKEHRHWIAGLYRRN